MRRSSSTSALASLPQAPVLPSVHEHSQPPDDAAGGASDVGSSEGSSHGNPLDPRDPLARAFGLCATDDLDGLRLVYHAKPGVVRGVNCDNRTLLHVAASRGNLAMCRWLLSRGAPPEATDAWGSAPWHEARRGGHDDIASLLERASGDANPSSALLSRSRASNLIGPDMSQWSIKLSQLKLDDGRHGEPRWRGAFAEVTVARWRGLRVALKRVPHEDWDPEEQAVFRMELGIMSKLAHPHIVQFYGVCADLRPMALVTEVSA